MIRNVYLVLVSALLLSACGGGGDSDDPTPATSPNNSNIMGSWISEYCIPAEGGTSEGRILAFDTEQGVQVYVGARVDFNNDTCTAPASNVIYTAGEVTYSGTHTTSICVADKFDVSILLATDNYDGSNLVDGAAMQSLLWQNQLSDEIYDIACVYNNQLLLGLQDFVLDTSSSSRRPEEMDVSIPYDFGTASRASARGVVNGDSNISEVMNKMLQEVKEKI